MKIFEAFLVAISNPTTDEHTGFVVTILSNNSLFITIYYFLILVIMKDPAAHDDCVRAFLILTVDC